MREETCCSVSGCRDDCWKRKTQKKKNNLSESGSVSEKKNLNVSFPLLQVASVFAVHCQCTGCATLQLQLWKTKEKCIVKCKNAKPLLYELMENQHQKGGKPLGLHQRTVHLYVFPLHTEGFDVELGAFAAIVPFGCSNGNPRSLPRGANGFAGIEKRSARRFLALSSASLRAFCSCASLSIRHAVFASILSLVSSAATATSWRNLLHSRLCPPLCGSFPPVSVFRGTLFAASVCCSFMQLKKRGGGGKKKEKQAFRKQKRVP